MKTSAIIRIVVWSVVALLLIGMLVTALAGGNIFGMKLNFPSWNFNNGFSYSDSDQYTVGAGNIDAVGVDRLNINWLAGKVHMQVGDGDQITLSETGASSEDEELRYWVRDDELIVQYCAPRMPLFGSFLAKDLTVTVPQSLASQLERLEVNSTSAAVEIGALTAQTAEINAVSGRINLDGLHCGELKIDGVSGATTGSGVQADQVQVNTVSGAVDLGGAFQSLRGDSVSGAFAVQSSVCPDQLDISTISGAVSVTLPDNDGFTARYSSVSGGFSCDFAVTQSKDKAVYGDGGADFQFDTVSGGIRILQG